MFKQLFKFRAVKEWYERNERVLIPATLVLGVAVDFLTFTSIDIVSSFILLGVYLVLAGSVIIFLNAYDADLIPKQKNVYRYLRLSSPLLLQFTFGALLSGSFIFYFFSGTLFVSWPFIGFIVALMISNEIFRHYYLRPVVQIGVFFFILFSLASIIFPFVWKNIGVSIFLFSGVISLACIGGYIALLRLAVSGMGQKQWRFAAVVAVIFAFMNGLYFLNVMPPIPLALRDAALAHNIERVAGGYVLLVEDEPIWSSLIPGETFYKSDGAKVYVYTSIFAPEHLATTIVHHWQYYDETQKQWETRDKLSFPITGGVKTGYRGFSVKSQVPVGRWRVDVETERGQVLGRINFQVLPSSGNITFKTLIK